MKRILSWLGLVVISSVALAGNYPIPLPGTSGNLLTSNGTKWTSAAPTTSGQGGINYLTTSSSTASSDLEASVGSWLAYADAAGTTPVDATGGSPTLTCTRTTSSPLRGAGSFLVTKDAANRQGNGCSVAFTIDSADQGKPQQISFDYTIASGTFSGGTSSTDSDLAVYIYDVTNAVVVQPAAYKMDCAVASVNCSFKGYFQASSNSTSYRAALHVATTSASAWTIKADNMSVGPVVTGYGVPASDWIAFTPTINNFGTVSNNDAKYRRVGDSLHVMGQFTSGTLAGSTASLQLPSGLAIDNAKLPTTASKNYMVGHFFRHQASTSIPASTDGPWSTFIDGSTTDRVFIAASFSAGSAFNKENGSALGSNGETFSYSFIVPISGWSSNVQMSSDTDTRVVAAEAHASGAISWTATGGANFDVVDYDTHGAITTGANAWKYTAPVPGIYSVKIQTFAASTGAFVAVYKNGTIHKYITNFVIVVGGYLATGAVDVKLAAGDYIDVRLDGGTLTGSTSATGNVLYISRVSGPSQIAMSEKVQVLYTGNAGTALTADTTNIDFSTKVYDSHVAWSGTGFTAPRPAWYNYDGTIAVTASGGEGIEIYINTVRKYRASSAVASSDIVHFSGGTYLNAGDILSFRSDTNKTLSNSAVAHWIAISSQ